MSSRCPDSHFHIIGTWTRYSSWTARVVTVLEYFKIPYNATYVHLSDVKSVSPSGFVPVLEVSTPELTINDSLAICEFLAESYPDKLLWPKDRQLRAMARSATAEMHSGFSELRNTYHTNFLAQYTGDIPITEQGAKDIKRMLTLWGEARLKTASRLRDLGEIDEGYLFGSFSIADAFFWPVLWRFRTYDLPLENASIEAISWMRKMWNDPVLKALGRDYFRQAERPETLIEKYEDIFKGNERIRFGRFEEEWEFPA